MDCPAVRRLHPVYTEVALLFGLGRQIVCLAAISLEISVRPSLQNKLSDLGIIVALRHCRVSRDVRESGINLELSKKPSSRKNPAPAHYADKT